MMTMYMVGASQTFVRRERRESLQRSAALDLQRLEKQGEVRRAEITRDVLVAYSVSGRGAEPESRRMRRLPASQT